MLSNDDDLKEAGIYRENGQYAVKRDHVRALRRLRTLVTAGDITFEARVAAEEIENYGRVTFEEFYPVATGPLPNGSRDFFYFDAYATSRFELFLPNNFKQLAQADERSIVRFRQNIY